MENDGSVRQDVEVVLWHGSHRNDGLQRLSAWSQLSGINLYNICMEGNPGDWRVVAKAYASRDRGEWSRAIIYPEA